MPFLEGIAPSLSLSKSGDGGDLHPLFGLLFGLLAFRQYLTDNVRLVLFTEMIHSSSQGMIKSGEGFFSPFPFTAFSVRWHCKCLFSTYDWDRIHLTDAISVELEVRTFSKLEPFKVVGTQDALHESPPCLVKKANRSVRCLWAADDLLSKDENPLCWYCR